MIVEANPVKNYNRYWAREVVKRAEEKYPRGYMILYNYFGFSPRDLAEFLATGSKKWPLVRLMARFLHEESLKYQTNPPWRQIAEKVCQMRLFAWEDWLILRLDSKLDRDETEFAPD